MHINIILINKCINISENLYYDKLTRCHTSTRVLILYTYDFISQDKISIKYDPHEHVNNILT